MQMKENKLLGIMITQVRCSLYYILHLFTFDLSNNVSFKLILLNDSAIAFLITAYNL